MPFAAPSYTRRLFDVASAAPAASLGVAIIRGQSSCSADGVVTDPGTVAPAGIEVRLSLLGVPYSQPGGGGEDPGGEPAATETTPRLSLIGLPLAQPTGPT